MKFDAVDVDVFLRLLKSEPLWMLVGVHASCCPLQVQSVDEADDGTDLNMMCSSITEVEPVSCERFSNLATTTSPLFEHVLAPCWSQGRKRVSV